MQATQVCFHDVLTVAKNVCILGGNSLLTRQHDPGLINNDIGLSNLCTSFLSDRE